MSDESQEPFRVFETEDDYRAHLEAEVTKARKAGEQRGKRQTQGMSAAERAELEELRQEREAAEEARMTEEQRWKEFDAKREKKHQEEVSAREARIQTLTSQLRHDRCYLELVRAAQPLAYNPEQVARLLSDRLALGDDGQAVVVSESGDVVDGVTPAQLVEQFLGEESNANLVKAVAGSGSGARGSNGKAGPTELARLEEELKAVQAEAQETGQPLRYAGKVQDLGRQIRALKAEA